MSKRFYATAAVQDVDDGFAVTLDDRAIKTPAGQPLIVPTRTLADAVAGEWNAQGEEIDPQSMAMMQLCATAIDRVPGVRDGLIDGILRYADTDLLCHRAAHPADLVARQAMHWQPLLDWAADELGARLTMVTGVVAVNQDPAARAALWGHLQNMDDWTLTAMGELVGISGSIVVGLAVFKGHIDAGRAVELCQLDEDHQNELWGTDEDALARRANISADLHTAAQFLHDLTA